MLQAQVSPIPNISISCVLNQSFSVETHTISYINLPMEADPLKPQYTLPSNQSLRRERHGQLSPLSPPPPSGGMGIERLRFEAMLKAAREKSALIGARKPLELRKEIAFKAQKSKQLERRAQFLSKLVAPPSPTAIDLPVTPPDSPAVFHFTLPSPGLESPLELFENVINHPELYQPATRIEQVDFRLPYKKHVGMTARSRGSVKTAGLVPSLDQISQRLSKDSPLICTPVNQKADGSSRLPSFLRKRRTVSTACEVTPETTPLSKDLVSPQPPPVLLVSATLPVRMPPLTAVSKSDPHMSPPSPLSLPSPRPAGLVITTTLCPPTRSNSSPTELTEENISMFGSHQSKTNDKVSVPNVPDRLLVASRRAQVTKDMFDKLSRRNPGFLGGAVHRIKAKDDTSPVNSLSGTEDKVKRRISAPAELSAVPRRDRHPILLKPGGF